MGLNKTQLIKYYIYIVFRNGDCCSKPTFRISLGYNVVVFILRLRLEYPSYDTPFRFTTTIPIPKYYIYSI